MAKMEWSRSPKALQSVLEKHTTADRVMPFRPFTIERDIYNHDRGQWQCGKGSRRKLVKESEEGTCVGPQ
jgi:hypothetical protein